MKHDYSATIEEVKLVEEDGKYYLSMTYVLENDKYVKRYVVPRIDLGINTRTCVPELTREVGGHLDTPTIGELGRYYRPLEDVVRFRCGLRTFDVGYGKINGMNVKFKEQLIEEKTQKLTISEIEKKLGYKIEIVAEKEDKK